ncbi:SdpI family protein [Nonomuraea cavernae]|nr:SdpI family protein [Nonomuraea cavernae]MCA2190721.1 SdpI family protein [Nonomuraea cavernae]
MNSGTVPLLIARNGAFGTMWGMGPVLVTSLTMLPSLALLLIAFHDESGTVDTRNRLSGLRTRETLASPEAWNAAHTWMRRPLRRLAGALAVVIGAAVISDTAFTLPEALEFAIIGAQLTILIGGLLLICRRANRVATQVNRQASSKTDTSGT